MSWISPHAHRTPSYPQTSRRPTTRNHRDVEPSDRVSLSGMPEEKRNPKKMALLGALGTAVGVTAALLIPGAGFGALVLSGLVGAIAGTAIGDGALETAGTVPQKRFDPYNTSDLLDPDNLYHPQHPYNPLRQ